MFEELTLAEAGTVSNRSMIVIALLAEEQKRGRVETGSTPR